MQTAGLQPSMTSLPPAPLGPEEIALRIVVLRGQRVLIDADLARIYAVETRRLNEQVKRNSRRFPEDFVFQLTAEEKAKVVADCDHLRNLRFAKSLPYAFTEYGAIQAANVLNSDAAVEMGVHVVRAFVRLRQWLSTQKAFAKKWDDGVRSHEDGVGPRSGPARGPRPRAAVVGRSMGGRTPQLESRVGQQDEQLAAIVEALRQLTVAPEPHHGRRMGFHQGNR